MQHLLGTQYEYFFDDLICLTYKRRNEKRYFIVSTELMVHTHCFRFYVICSAVVLYGIKNQSHYFDHSHYEDSLRTKLSTKSCFMKQKCHLQIGVTHYKNAATPLST